MRIGWNQRPLQRANAGKCGRRTFPPIFRRSSRSGSRRRRNLRNLRPSGFPPSPGGEPDAGPNGLPGPERNVAGPRTTQKRPGDYFRAARCRAPAQVLQSELFEACRVVRYCPQGSQKNASVHFSRPPQKNASVPFSPKLRIMAS
jgi:hypothetical protein